jgi:hypothetical protein
MPEDRPGSAEETLRRLEARLDRASEAAERLMAQAAEAAAGGAAPGGAAAGANPPAGGNPPAGEDPSAAEGAAGADPPRGEPAAGADPPGKPPPAGWQIPEDARAGTDELDPFLALAQALRDLVPPDLQRRLVAAIRELLLALRALIDWYLERLERRREQAVEVQDIPIL